MRFGWYCIAFRKWDISSHTIRQLMLWDWLGYLSVTLYASMVCQLGLMQIWDFGLDHLFGDRYVSSWELIDECQQHFNHRRMARLTG